MQTFRRSFPGHGCLTCCFVKAHCQIFYDIGHIITDIGRQFDTRTLTGIIAAEDDEINDSFADRHIGLNLLSSFSRSVRYFFTVGEHLVRDITGQAAAVVLLVRSLERNLAAERTVDEVGLEVAGCCWCSVGCRHCREVECHEHRRLRIAADRCHVSVAQVDRIELELSVLVGRSPEELVGPYVELAALGVVLSLGIGNLYTGRALLRFSTCRTVNLVEVTFLADTIGETVIGNTQCHIGVLGRSDSGTRQGGVV